MGLRFLEFSSEAGSRRSYIGISQLVDLPMLASFTPLPIENEEPGILDYVSVFYKHGWHYIVPKSLKKQAILKKLKVVNQQTCL